MIVGAVASGTSADALDVAAVELSRDADTVDLRLPGAGTAIDMEVTP